MKLKTVLVIGLGPMGTSLVEELWDTNVEIVVIDRDPVAVDAVKDKAHAGSSPFVTKDASSRC